MTPTKQEAERRPSWCCQKCGAPIGWLGRLIPWLHGCCMPQQKTLPVETIHEVHEPDQIEKELIVLAEANMVYPTSGSIVPPSAVYRKRVIQFGRDVLKMAREK